MCCLEEEYSEILRMYRTACVLFTVGVPFLDASELAGAAFCSRTLRRDAECLCLRGSLRPTCALKCNMQKVGARRSWLRRIMSGTAMSFASSFFLSAPCAASTLAVLWSAAVGAEQWLLRCTIKSTSASHDHRSNRTQPHSRMLSGFSAASVLGAASRESQAST